MGESGVEVSQQYAEALKSSISNALIAGLAVGVWVSSLRDGLYVGSIWLVSGVLFDTSFIWFSNRSKS